MKHKQFAGKYWLWKNGLRFKVLDECNQYGDWIVENPITCHRWAINPITMQDATEITEEEAKRQHFDISKSTTKAVICNCCAWKIGQSSLNVEMKIGGDLKNKTIPNDEVDRLQKELRDFFRQHGVTTILPYVRPTLDKQYQRDGGIRLEFITTSPGK